MAFALKQSTRATMATSKSTSRTPRVKVVAQAQSLRAAGEQHQEQPQRVVAAHASSNAAFALTSPAAEGNFLGQLGAFFGVMMPQHQAHEEDEEWRQLFGQYLDPAEEQGGRHGMFVSHLAERMATEPHVGRS